MENKQQKEWPDYQNNPSWDDRSRVLYYQDFRSDHNHIFGGIIKLSQEEGYNRFGLAGMIPGGMRIRVCRICGRLCQDVDMDFKSGPGFIRSDIATAEELEALDDAQYEDED